MTEPNAELQEAINNAGFTVFECISDHGFYSWDPPRDAKKQQFRRVTAADFVEHLDLEGRPDNLAEELVKTVNADQTSPSP